MFIPFISSSKTLKNLYRRQKGGGGGSSGSGASAGGGAGASGAGRGGGSIGGSSAGGSIGGSSGGGSSGGGRSSGSSGGGSTGAGGGSGGRSSSISSSGSSMSASSYGGGGGKPSTIPSGQSFAGRTEGGGTRGQVFGSRTYGSGYPGEAGRGVASRGFPFVFWPLAWGGAAGLGAGAYLDSDEYGAPNNASRPGGIMVVADFQSNVSSTVFRIVADNSSVTSLISDIRNNCSSHLSSSSSTTPLPFNESDSGTPKPEQVVQYYRASSVALTLDGYNNTAIYAPEGTPDTPLPTSIDTTLLDCLNQTIALAVPLIDGADSQWATPNMGLVGLAWVLWCLSSFI